MTLGSSDVRAEIEKLVSVSGEPLADPAWMPASMLSRRAVNDVRMVLVGEGADELFGGYPTYIGALLADRYARWPRPVRAAIAAAVRALPVSDRKVTISYLLKRFVDGNDFTGVARHLVWTSQIQPSLLQRLGVAESDAGSRARRAGAHPRCRPAERFRDDAGRRASDQGRPCRVWAARSSCARRFSTSA